MAHVAGAASTSMRSSESISSEFMPKLLSATGALAGAGACTDGASGMSRSLEMAYFSSSLTMGGRQSHS